jgi:hypothetical protein
VVIDARELIRRPSSGSGSAKSDASVLKQVEQLKRIVARIADTRSLNLCDFMTVHPLKLSRESTTDEATRVQKPTNRVSHST